MIHILGLLVLLIPCTVTDLRTGTVPVIYILSFAMAAVILNLTLSLKTIPEMLFGMVPFLLFLPISFLTKGAIGRGDCVLFLAIGVWCGFTDTMTILLVSFLTAGLAGLAIVLVKKKSMKTVLPFVPFLGAGWLAELLLTLTVRTAV